MAAQPISSRPSGSLSLTQAAVEMGISRSGVWRLVDRGELPHYRIGKRVLIDRADMKAYMDAHKSRRVQAS